MKDILKKYFAEHESCDIQPFGSGLINSTFRVTHPSGASQYILQKINSSVFPEPGKIMENISALSRFFETHYPDYVFLKPLLTLTGEPCLTHNSDCYRMFPFIENSVSYDVPQNPEQAGFAAKAFGKFSAQLNSFPVETLHITIPDFHNLSKRYFSFYRALSEGNEQRIERTRSIANELLDYEWLVETYRQIDESAECIKRVMHHDTKISNVLFNPQGEIICLVDLDTIMPGYFISDVGDMMRNYLSPAGEEETDYSKIRVRMDYFEALATGYLSEMHPVLTPTEKSHFAYSGLFITYMQALRFYTDYLLNDIYYPVSHPEHNLQRTENQLVLLARLKKMAPEMQQFVDDFRP